MIKDNKRILESLYIPDDNILDAICLLGSWYIKTNAGNLQTARETLVSFTNSRMRLSLVAEYLRCSTDEIIDKIRELERDAALWQELGRYCKVE